MKSCILLMKLPCTEGESWRIGEAIRAKGKEIEAIDAQLIREKIDFQIEMRKVLTPEQLQRWYVVMDQQPATKKPIR